MGHGGCRPVGIAALDEKQRSRRDYPSKDAASVLGYEPLEHIVDFRLWVIQP